MENISCDSQRPVFRVNLSSKRLMALTLIAYAVTDDRDGTDCMDDAVRHYYEDKPSEAGQGREIWHLLRGREGDQDCKLGMFLNRMETELNG